MSSVAVSLVLADSLGYGDRATDSGRREEENTMSEHIYKVIEIVGSSTTSSDDAVRNAIARASQTLKNLDWFQLVETRGHLVDGQIAHFQVTLKVGFRLE
jgi:flavin-binding protein dodecin